jgi:hypothetical protein
MWKTSESRFRTDKAEGLIFKLTRGLRAAFCITLAALDELRLVRKG